MKNIFLSIAFSAGLLMTPFSMVEAAEMYFIPPVEMGVVDTEIAVDLYLDTSGKTINALSGKVTVVEQQEIAQSSSNNTRTSPVLRRIHDGDSIVGAWLTKANTTDPNRITFSGIIPGGIAGKGKIMTFYLVPKQSGTITLSVTGSVFENKASPAPLLLRLNSIAIPIRERAPNDAMSMLSSGDVTPPIIIRAIIAENNEMFDGKPFIIINAKDSESGIATYELLETGEEHQVDTLTKNTSLPWRLVDNPAPLLAPQETVNFVYLRVTDREGNAAAVEVSRRAQLSPESGEGLFNKWLMYATLIVAALLFLWLWDRRRTHHV